MASDKFLIRTTLRPCNVNKQTCRMPRPHVRNTCLSLAGLRPRFEGFRGWKFLDRLVGHFFTEKIPEIWAVFVKNWAGFKVFIANLAGFRNAWACKFLKERNNFFSDDLTNLESSMIFFMSDFRKIPEEGKTSTRR